MLGGFEVYWRIDAAAQTYQVTLLDEPPEVLRMEVSFLDISDANDTHLRHEVHYLLFCW